jgi:putative tricarboxylic transport membrane protein
MTALLLAYGFALEPVGYIISTFVLFLGGSWLLGSRAWRRDVAVGLGLSVGIYFLFTQLLAVPLPAGVIPVG